MTIKKSKQSYAKVKLHPVTLKEISKGHPWIIKDSYTDKFPSHERILIGLDHKGEAFCQFLHDPNHKKVKGRVWSFKQPFANRIGEFWHEWEERVANAVERRIKLDLFSKRENAYLVFGEADALPGIFIQKLGKNILIQYFSHFWHPWQKEIHHNLKKILSRFFPLECEEFVFYAQERDQAEKLPPKVLTSWEITPKLVVEEFGVQYQLHMDQHYDVGLYTDMAATREKLAPYLSGRVLNLYAYTGAFSLYALKQGAKEVISVDQSKKYGQYLLDNLALNASQLDEQRHRLIINDVEKALPSLIKEGKKFDCIIVDPPSYSASKTGKQGSSRVEEKFAQILPSLIELLADGGVLALFMNTHRVKFSVFKQSLFDLLKSIPQAPSFKVVQELQLAEDCPSSKNFSEGNYLKGLLLRK